MGFSNASPLYIHLCFTTVDLTNSKDLVMELNSASLGGQGEISRHKSSEQQQQTQLSKKLTPRPDTLSKTL